MRAAARYSAAAVFGGRSWLVSKVAAFSYAPTSAARLPDARSPGSSP